MIVVNKHTHTPTDKDVYIGRPSIFGNPFTHLTGATKAVYLLSSREACLREYHQWLYRNIDPNADGMMYNQALVDAILALPDDAVLVCWCKPLTCHGDILIRAHAWLKTQVDRAPNAHGTSTE